MRETNFVSTPSSRSKIYFIERAQKLSLASCSRGEVCHLWRFAIHYMLEAVQHEESFHQGLPACKDHLSTSQNAKNKGTSFLFSSSTSLQLYFGLKVYFFLKNRIAPLIGALSHTLGHSLSSFCSIQGGAYLEVSLHPFFTLHEPHSRERMYFLS